MVSGQGAPPPPDGISGWIDPPVRCTEWEWLLAIREPKSADDATPEMSRLMIGGKRLPHPAPRKNDDFHGDGDVT